MKPKNMFAAWGPALMTVLGILPIADTLQDGSNTVQSSASPSFMLSSSTDQSLPTGIKATPGMIPSITPGMPFYLRGIPAHILSKHEIYDGGINKNLNARSCLGAGCIYYSGTCTGTGCREYSGNCQGAGCTSHTGTGSYDSPMPPGSHTDCDNEDCTVIFHGGVCTSYQGSPGLPGSPSAPRDNGECKDEDCTLICHDGFCTSYPGDPSLQGPPGPPGPPGMPGLPGCRSRWTEWARWTNWTGWTRWT